MLEFFNQRIHECVGVNFDQRRHDQAVITKMYVHMKIENPGLGRPLLGPAMIIVSQRPILMI